MTGPVRAPESTAGARKDAWLPWFVAAALAVAAPLPAQTLVSALGGGGWYADDSRNGLGQDLIGASFTHFGKPGQAASSADDTAIAQRLWFDGSSTPPGGHGALHFVVDAQPGFSSKSTISKVNTGGFATASSLTDPAFSATYTWSQSPARNSTSLSFRLGLQTSLYGAAGGSQTGFTATRTGESVWDVILVYVPPTGTAGAWNTTTITADTVGWKVYFQAGNSFWQENYGLTSASGATGVVRSLAQWAAFDYDPNTPGVQSFLAGASVTSIQFGLGSSTAADGEALLAGFSTTLLPESYAFAAVPEPAGMAMGGAVAALIYTLNRRRRALRP